MIQAAEPVRRATLRRAERLSGSAVAAVLRCGTRWDGRGLRIVWRASDAGRDRGGFVVSRTAGTAVERNRYRRRLREVFRRNKSSGPVFRDVVLIARGSGTPSFAELEEEYRKWCGARKR